jgi:hypothetical protein
MKGQLTKIQNLLKHHDSDNKQLGVELLKAYCKELNYAPTLLHVLEKGPRVETGQRIHKIKARITQETSQRMGDILNRHILDHYLLKFRQEKPNFYKFSIRVRLWEPDQFGKIYKRLDDRRKLYYHKNRNQMLYVHQSITAGSPETRIEIRKRNVSTLMRNLLEKKINRFYSKLDKTLKNEKATKAV